MMLLVLHININHETIDVLRNRMEKWTVLFFSE